MFDCFCRWHIEPRIFTWLLKSFIPSIDPWSLTRPLVRPLPLNITLLVLYYALLLHTTTTATSDGNQQTMVIGVHSNTNTNYCCCCTVYAYVHQSQTLFVYCCCCCVLGVCSLPATTAAAVVALLYSSICMEKWVNGSWFSSDHLLHTSISYTYTHTYTHTLLKKGAITSFASFHLWMFFGSIQLGCGWMFG